MSRSTRSGPDDSTARAFLRVGWPNLLAKLHRYATSTLHLAAIDADRADMVEAVDLVNALVVKGLTGTLTWTLPEHATDDEVVGYACTKLYGMRSTLRRKDALTLRDDGDALEERADEAPDALTLLVEQRGIAGVLAEPGAGDDAFDEEMRAELARRGLTLETWAAEIRARAQAVQDRNRRARRMRTLKIAAAGAAGIAVAGGVALALQSSIQGPAGDARPMMLVSKESLPPVIVLDAGVDASRRK